MRYEKHGLSGKCGVYLITNTINGKRYIGASVDVGKRIGQHFTTAARRYNGINNFYTDICIMGRDVFTYELLEECSRDTKLETERKWYHKIKFSSRHEKKQHYFLRFLILPCFYFLKC